ncbi:MAG TPA: cytochrome c3 family protein, partial [Steroidobacteraceae bacterium]
RIFSLSQHRRIGWIALYLAATHAVWLLAAQPLIGHYLLPSAPLYMLCGLAAFIALAILVATGIRARITAHAALAALLLALLGAHIIGSGQMIDRPAKVITTCALLGLAVFGSVWRRGIVRSRARSLWTLIPSCIALVVLALLPTPTGRSLLLYPAMVPPLVEVHFPHEKHTAVNCITCHHNFADKTGLDNCLDCHRSARRDLPQPAEVTFHVFCRDCHREFARLGEDKHGPVRECSGCHVRTGAVPR